MLLGVRCGRLVIVRLVIVRLVIGRLVIGRLVIGLGTASAAPAAG